jgi:hypothetical protein
MLVFFAGSGGTEATYEPLLQQVKQRLLSYHYMTPSLDNYYFNPENRKHFSHIIIDSGAFSAWNRGAIIDLDKYAEYCLKYIDHITWAVNLDVIPGKPGDKTPSDAEIQRSAEKGYKNYLYLIDKGIPKEKLIHVFHQNEDFSWLEKMVEEMEYIGLSPANDRTVQEKIQWLDKCMPYVTNPDGTAKVKFHGFAVTSFKLMKRYPWFSVDSSTWATVAGRGIIFVPQYKGGTTEWDYWVEPTKYSMSQVVAKKDHVVLQVGEAKERVLRYLDEYNIPTGEYKFKVVSQSYVLQDKERVCSEKYIKNLCATRTQCEGSFSSMNYIEAPYEVDENGFYSNVTDVHVPAGFKLVEMKIVRGITNDWRFRQFFNSMFLRKFGELKKEPAKFIRVSNKSVDKKPVTLVKE